VRVDQNSLVRVTVGVAVFTGSTGSAGAFFTQFTAASRIKTDKQVKSIFLIRVIPLSGFMPYICGFAGAGAPL